MSTQHDAQHTVSYGEYATNLTDAEWEVLAPCSLAPRRPDGRAVIPGARFSLPFSTKLRSGSAWLYLPQEWPPWHTVNHYVRRWRLEGTWERIHTIRVSRAAAPLGGRMHMCLARPESSAEQGL